MAHQTHANDVAASFSCHWTDPLCTTATGASLHESFGGCHTQVVLTNLRVDVPRCSWSPEMYTLSCAQARLLLPVAEEQVANMMPDMSRCASLLEEDHHRLYCCVK